MNDLLRTILFLPPQATAEATSLDELHYFVIFTTMAGAALTTVLALWLCVRYRYRGEGDGPSRFRPAPKTPAWMEVGVVVGLFGLFIVWWGIGFEQYVRIRVAPEQTLDIYVTGKQWMWKFAYPGGQHSISTLFVPAGRPVKLILSSRDVIHSFYVPDFRLKQDVVPGRVTTLWFSVKAPGRHPVYCAEYCGTNHSVMRAEVVALDPADYSRWLSAGTDSAQIGAPEYVEPAVVGQWPPKEELSLVRLGELAAAQDGCLRCHTLDGTPHIGPTWAGAYGRKVLLQGGGSVIADEAYLTESMMDPGAKIHAGFSSVMPSYQGILRPAETAAIVELIKSLRGVTAAQSRPASQQGLPPPPALLPNSVPLPTGPVHLTVPRGGKP